MSHFDIASQRSKSASQAKPAAARSSEAVWLVIILVAVAPSIMALATWAPDNHFTIALYWIRFFAPPILLIELLAIAIAMRGGFRPSAVVMALPRHARFQIMLLVAIAFGSAVAIATNPAIAILRSTINMLHLIFGLSIAHFLKNVKSLNYSWIFRIIAYGSVSYCLILVAFVLRINDPARYDWLHFALGVVNIRHIGFYLVPGAAILMGIVALNPLCRLYWVNLAMLTLFFAIFFWSGSRAPVMSLVAACGLMVCLLPQFRKARFAAAIGLCVISGAMLSTIHSVPNLHFGLVRISFSVSRETADDLSSGRLDIWAGSLRESLKKPLFGHGEDQFIDLVPEARGIFYHPHNAVIQILVQWGLAGLILMAALTATIWRKLFKIAKSRNEIIPAFLAINALLLYSLVDGVFYFIYPMMILTFLVAVCLSAGRDGGGEAPYAERAAP